MNELIRLYKGHYACVPESCVPLPGSASNRKYYRLSGAAGSCIGVIGTDARENEAFVTLSRHFTSKGINVPEVLGVSDDGMAYIQEDLGNEVLFDKFAKACRCGEGVEEVEALLCRVMSELPDIQFRGAAGLDFSVCYPQPAFDRRMIMFDLNYFKYCFLKPSGLEFDEVLLQDEFERFASELLAEDSDTFLYRDLNARNVMVREGIPYYIDFQGGRRGPVHYDVASFVYHARAEYPAELQEKMLECYLSELQKYMNVDHEAFIEKLKWFRLFRMFQTLGAYGFRGLVEQKADFVSTIPATLEQLKELQVAVNEKFPYMAKILEQLVFLPRFAKRKEDGVLELTVTSFSYRKGMPFDPSGNGGGYIFDCRALNNPGRHIQYKNQTGRDEPVIRFLEEDGGVFDFLEHVYGVLDPHIETFMNRGFTSLMLSFGCTGGQHRSVYCAEQAARHIVAKYPQVRVRLIHREQNITEHFDCSCDYDARL